MSRATGMSLATISLILPSLPMMNAVRAEMPFSGRKTPYFSATAPRGWKSARSG